MKKLLVNILCIFIFNKHKRHMFRLRFNYPIRKWVQFAKSFSSVHNPRVRCTCGYRGINLVVNVDDKYVFKFPLHTNGAEIATREKRITDALRPISPIKIPKMEIVYFDDLAIRKYECVRGIGFHDLERAEQDAHVDKIARQLAKFFYVVGMADPKEIRDLKNNKNEKPSIMHGWNQNDLWDNFIMNPRTFDIVAIIDWEEAVFGDFYTYFTSGTGNRAMKVALLREYLNLYVSGSIRK